MKKIKIIVQKKYKEKKNTQKRKCKKIEKKRKGNAYALLKIVRKVEK